MKNALTPDELDLVARVTDEASKKIGCDDVVKAAIGARVFRFANKGERRYETLLAIALDRTTN